MGIDSVSADLEDFEKRSSIEGWTETQKEKALKSEKIGGRLTSDDGSSYAVSSVKDVMGSYANAWRKRNGVKDGDAADVFGNIVLAIAAGQYDINNFTSGKAKALLTNYFSYRNIPMPTLPGGDAAIERIGKILRNHVAKHYTKDPKYYSLVDASKEIEAYAAAPNPYQKTKMIKKWKEGPFDKSYRKKNPNLTHKGGKHANKWDLWDLVDPEHPSILALKNESKYSISYRLYEGEEPEEVVDAEVEDVGSVVDLHPDTMDLFRTLDAELEKLAAVYAAGDTEDVQEKVEDLPEELPED